MHNIICLAKDATLRPKKDKDVLSLEWLREICSPVRLGSVKSCATSPTFTTGASVHPHRNINNNGRRYTPIGTLIITVGGGTFDKKMCHHMLT
jgi:hypothetical protein